MPSATLNIKLQAAFAEATRLLADDSNPFAVDASTCSPSPNKPKPAKRRLFSDTASNDEVSEYCRLCQIEAEAEFERRWGDFVSLCGPKQVARKRSRQLSMAYVSEGKALFDGHLKSDLHPALTLQASFELFPASGDIVGTGTMPDLTDE